MTPNLTIELNPVKKRDVAWPFAVANGEAGRIKILVVDDDPQIRASLHKMLQAEGYEVLLAADGREGIGIIGADAIDLLLLDVSLPDMSGWQVFGTLAAINPFVPTIIITGKDDQSDLMVLSGAVALIEKPINVSRLLQVVAETRPECLPSSTPGWVPDAVISLRFAPGEELSRRAQINP
jgi:CheY-like chemotaxis protein